MYGVGGKPLSGIRSIYVNSLVSVKIKRGKECFSIACDIRQGLFMSPWLFNVYMDAGMKEGQMGTGRIGVKFLGEDREGRLPGILNLDEFFLCGETE